MLALFVLGAQPAAGARLRVAHASPDVGAIDVYVGTAKVAESLTFGAVTAYLSVTPGDLDLAVRRAGSAATTTPLARARLAAAAGSAATGIVWGRSAGVAVLAVADGGAPPTGRGDVRFVHVAEAPALDVADAAGGGPLVAGLAAGAASGYVTVEPGDHRFVLQPAGGGGALLETAAMRIDPGRSVTVVVMGAAGGQPPLQTLPLADGGLPGAGAARLRLAHFAPLAASGVGTALAVYIDGVLVLPSFTYGEVTSPLDLSAGGHSVDLRLGGASLLAPPFDLTLATDSDTTLAVFGTATAGYPLRLLPLTDTAPAPQEGAGLVRLAHLASDPAAAAIDVRVRGTAVADDLAYGRATGYTSWPAGPYELVFTSADGRVTLLAPPAVVVAKGDVRTLLVVGDGAARPLALVDVPFAGSGAGTRRAAHVRVAHAVAGLGALDVYVDGERVDGGLAFGQVTGYRVHAAGVHEIALRPAGAAPGSRATLLLPGELAVGSDSTLVVIGRPATPRGLLLADDNRPPLGEKAHLRFVHAVPDAGALELVLGGTAVAATEIDFGEASLYVPVDAGAATATLRLAAGGAPVGSPTALALEAGRVYTLLAIGLRAGSPAVSLVLVLDAPVVVPTPTPSRTSSATPTATSTRTPSPPPPSATPGRGRWLIRLPIAHRGEPES